MEKRNSIQGIMYISKWVIKVSWNFILKVRLKIWFRMKIDEEMYCIIFQVHWSPLTCSYSTVGPLLSLQWRRVEARGRSSSAPLHLPLTYTTPTYHDTALVKDSSGAEGNKRQPIMSASSLHNEDGRQIIIEVNQGYLCYAWCNLFI